MSNTFYPIIFLKKPVFSEKTVKNCFGCTFDDFVGEGGVLLQKLIQHLLSQIRYWIFYYLIVFSKKVVFSQKTGSEGQVPFEGKGASGDENEYNFFFSEMRFWIFFNLIIFSNKATFFEKIAEKNFWGTWAFFRRMGHLYTNNEY